MKSVVTDEGLFHIVPFLLRDAMLTWYMLWPCVRLSVCPPVRASIHQKTSVHDNHSLSGTVMLTWLF